MKIDCEVIVVNDIQYLELSGNSIPYQEMVVKDYEAPHSTLVLTLWGDSNIQYYNVKVGDKLGIEFMMIAKQGKDDIWRNHRIKIISISRHKPNWKPKTINGSDLYVIARDDNKALKVGRSKNVNKRLKTLQTSSEVKLKILKVYTDCGYLEKEIHDELKRRGQHIGGEWFKYNQKTFDIVENYCR